MIPLVAYQARLKAILALCGDKGHAQFCGRSKEHAVPGSARGEANCDERVRFADARWTNEKWVPLLGDEAGVE